ncbi:MAG TPA: fumarylacetoacetate hydrolase family protein [Rhizomicrobium sp.]|jgi:5-oxopent-3-ene-1,2,5-tricarboxylate decarboxylase/2-hydroxyhepta-2,4-diene-1,7-dioate isomerase|nr:fumarylacetoacetate hydrolase family protein [Rhizomicrobium sp.]
MVAGTIYGVALNDREHHAHLASSFEKPPYLKPPQRPVLYIKPRNCLMGPSDAIPLPRDLACLEAAPSLGLLIGRDAARVTPQAALGHVAGACLALDIGEADTGFYRPPVRQRCRDGFLRLGAMSKFDPALLEAELETSVNDRIAHRWNLGRLLRNAATLMAEIGSFMTLAAGDILLIGTPFDAPRAVMGDRITVRLAHLPSLSAQVRAEGAP